MSRYAADLERLATQLARMATDPATVAAATDAAVVNRARLAVRRWCRAVLDDVVLAKQSKTDHQPGLADLARSPVGVLQVLLGYDPQPLQLDPSSSQSGEAANEQWRRLADAVEVVAYEWSSSDPASRPSGEQAWATVADVAAVAEAAALLDRDLATRHPGTPGSRTTHDRWEIAVAAEHVRQLAASGPLVSAESLRPAAHRVRPVHVRKIDTLAPALGNLATLVTGARCLGPGTVGGLAATHARTVRTLADALAATGPPAQSAVRKQLAGSLYNHADTLINVQVAGRRLQSLDADDPRPALQMQEIRTGLRQLGASRTARIPFRNDQPSLLTAIIAALEFAPAAATSTYAHIQAGRWLQSRHGAELGWEKVTPDAPIAEVAMLVQGQARTLAKQLPQPRPAGLPHRSPHELLPPRLLRTDRRRGPSPASAHGMTFGDIAGGP